MKIIFTICSINYLAQAKTLYDSVKRKLPDYYFMIGLVDKIDEKLNRELLPDCDILEIANIHVDGFDQMLLTYNIVELNTAVKPFIFKHLFKTHPEASSVVYIDPDTIFFDPMTDLEKMLNDYNIVLTPHYSYPVFEEFSNQERSRLIYGLFNGGFLALKNSKESKLFLDWWGLKLQKQCLEDVNTRLYVDQMWLNFAPVNFEGAYNFRHVGYNVAYWNLHERALTKVDDVYFVNNEKLVFFHFSNFKIKETENRKYEYLNYREDVLDLLDMYYQRLIENGHDHFKSINCYYVVNAPAKIRESALKVFVKRFLRAIIRRLE